ncbi:YckD family protein [Gracilibacillus sp. D59]|uniref:YckD family protein n=1 Tax=Gracilibacillus sp. D59 TaxID=3457434 RepID=UPI003FCDAD2F
MSLRKLFMACILTVSIGGLFLSSVQAEPKDVKLSDEQIEEMKGLQKEAIEKEKQIIEKYVEYGVFTKEKAQKIIQHLEKKYEKLEENNFIPKWDHKHHMKRDKEAE